MITYESLLGVTAVALGMVLTPGPNMMYLVSRSITQGRRAGLISLGGVALGFLVYLTLATLGLSAFFAAVPELYLVIKLAGAAYLAWLAWQAVRPALQRLGQFLPQAGRAPAPPRSSPPRIL
jgi:threonine/homoserine/homoserine lactone efflux protein